MPFLVLLMLLLLLLLMLVTKFVGNIQHLYWPALSLYVYKYKYSVGEPFDFRYAQCSCLFVCMCVPSVCYVHFRIIPEFQYKSRVLTMMMAADLCWLSVLNATQSNASNNEYVASVVKLRTSKNVSTKGTVPIVQSQHKSHGNRSNQKFTDVK